MNIKELISVMKKNKLVNIQQVEFNCGDSIANIKDEIKYCYIIESGEIDIYYLNQNNKLYLHHNNVESKFIGIVELLSFHDKYGSTYKAVNKCNAYKIEKNEMKKFIKESNELKDFILNYWATYFYNISTYSQRYNSNQNRHKFISYMLNVAQYDEESDLYYLDLKREEIAEVLSCSSRTLYRAVNILIDKELIRKSGTTIYYTSTQLYSLKNEIK